MNKTILYFPKKLNYNIYNRKIKIKDKATSSNLEIKRKKEVILFFL